MADITKRLHYFNGQFLEEKDFSDEQEYHLDRLRRHNRLLHTYGIAEGLTVTGVVGAGDVTVGVGTALDNQGRMIVLGSGESLSLNSFAGKTVYVVISFDEVGTDPATVGNQGQPTRWEEQPKVELVETAGAPSEGTHIRLARVTVSGDRTVSSLDLSVRQLAGVRVGGELAIPRLKISSEDLPDSRWPEMTCDADRRVRLNEHLALSGNLSAGSIAATGAVTAASVTATGAVTGGSLSTAGNLTAAGITASGNVSGANLSTAGTVTAGGFTTTGTLAVNKVSSTGAGAGISTTGAVTAGSFSTTGNLSVAGITASGTISGANISTPGTLTAGNITSTGTLTFASLATTGGLTVGTDLTVAGRIGGTLANGIVKAASIGDGEVTTAKLADFAVTTNEIAAHAVNNAKLALGAVSLDRLDNSLQALVQGGFSRWKLATVSFDAGDGTGTTQPVDLGFRPRLIIATGHAQALLAGDQQGGATGGFADLTGSLFVYHCWGTKLERRGTAPYLIHGSDTNTQGFVYGNLIDKTTTRQVSIYITVHSASTAGIVARVAKISTLGGHTVITDSAITARLLCLA